jgi:hypothetical protein
MFIDEWFHDFYQKLPLGHHNKQTFGQLFWTQTYYPHENLQLWRPVPDATELTKTFASHFRIEAAGQDAFQRNLPLHDPKLETNEEFIVVRAKRRPIVLVRPETPSWGIDPQGYRGKIQRRRCLVAQIYGLADTQTGQSQFPQTLIDKVRKMEYPELMFLPQRAGLLEVDSLLRLDELQTVFTPHLASTGFALHDEVISILCGQLQMIFTGMGTKDYMDLREMLLRESS